MVVWLQLYFLSQLSQPADLNAYVQPVTLPDKNTPSLWGDVCKVSGWGVTQLHSVKLSAVLQAVNVRENPFCNWYYWGKITSNMMCAGSIFGGKDSCQVQIPHKFCFCAGNTFNMW